MDDVLLKYPILGAIDEAVGALRDLHTAEEEPSTWNALLASVLVDLVASGEPAAADGIPAGAMRTPSVTSCLESLQDSRVTVGHLRDMLSTNERLDGFLLLPPDCFPIFRDHRPLPVDGFEEWYINEFATDTVSALHRHIAILTNAAEVADQRKILSSEIQNALVLMYLTLVGTALPRNLSYDREICATIFSAVRTQARVLHAWVDGLWLRISYSRYFDTTKAEEVEALFALAKLEESPIEAPASLSPLLSTKQTIPIRHPSKAYLPETFQTTSRRGV